VDSPKKESFVYFSESHQDFTIALRVEILHVENLHGKLVDNVSHKSDVTSLQDPFTSFSMLETLPLGQGLLAA